MSERIALDLRNYNTPEKLGNIVSDTASLSIEASNNKDIPRVNPYFYIRKDNNRVIPPGKDKRDVSDRFTEETYLDRVATIAGNETKRILLEDNIGTTFVWISPSYPYPETRISIGVKKETKSKRFQYLECYGISTTLSREDSLKLSQLLVSTSKDDCQFPNDAEDIRSLVIKVEIPKGREPFEYLSKIIDLPEKDIFQSILDGSVSKNKANAVKAAVIATKPVRENPHVIYVNPIRYGGYIETQMKHLGYEMNPTKFGCGISNNDVRTNNSYSYSNTTQTPEYSKATITAEDHFNCPRCDYAIPSGEGIETCPGCGLTKAEAGSTCG